MIRLKKIVLRNWCQHEHLEVAFGTVTAILGPIGSGKTNLINAVVFALTGEIRDADNKQSNVRQAAGGAPSDVYLEFDTDGAACDIRRSVTSSSVRLRVGEEVYKSSAEVKKALASLLRLDANLVKDYLFVRQWGMFDFLSQTDAVRQRTFAALFGLERAERLWALLGDYKLPDVQLSVNEPAVRAELAELAQAQASDERRKLELEASCLREDVRVFLQRRVQDYGRFARESEELHRRRQAVAIEQASAATFADALAQRDLWLEEAKSRYARVQGAAQRYASATAEVQAWSRMAHGLAADRQALAQLEQELAALASRRPASPDLFLGEAEEALARTSLQQFRADLHVAQHELRGLLGLGGAARCPTCGSEVDQAAIAARTPKLREAEAAAVSRICDLERRLSITESHRKSLALFESALAAKTAAVDARRQALASVAEVKAPAHDLPVLGESAREENAARACIDELERQRVAILADRGSALERAKIHAESAAALEASLAGLTPSTPEEYAEAVRVLAQDSGAAMELRAAVQQLAVWKQRIVAAEAMLAKAAEERKRFERVAGVRSRLAALRDVFHREKAPAVLAKEAMTSMASGIDQILEASGARFSISHVEDLTSANPLTFHLAFPDGSVQPAGRLSGGQKVLLALAFRLTLTRMFTDNLGLLCLDEPTAGLNASNIDDVGLLFSQLRSDGRAKGMQIVLVTHDASLARFCDQVVDLASAQGNR